MNNLEVMGRIHSIETFGAIDGPGIRFIVFMQGCMLSCLYCHNPDSWDSKSGQLISVGELINKIMAYKNYLSGGLTISGGEPLMQRNFTLALLQEAKNRNIHTALDTSGAIDIELAKPILDTADLILLDIKAANPNRYEEITGNKKSYDYAYAVLNHCEDTKKPVWIRHVLLSEYTLFDNELETIAQKLKAYSCIERVELLPFHKMGEHKWDELGFEYKLHNIKAPEQKAVEHAIDIFKKHGINVR